MRRFELILVGVVAVVGLLAAGVWAYTGVKSWKAEMLERKVNMGGEVSPETLVEVWEQARGLDETFLTGTHVHLPGLAAQMVVLEDRLPMAIRVEALMDGEASVRNALAREPAHSHGWARLAWFEQFQNGPSPRVVDALRMSIYTAPAKKSLLLWRIETAGVNREHWDDEFENLVRRQVVYGERVAPGRLEEVLESTGMEDLAGEGIM